MAKTNDSDPIDALDKAAASLDDASEHLEQGMRSVRNVIKVSDQMRDAEIGDPTTVDQRIINGETELAALQQELDAVREGDPEALTDAASTMPPRGHESNPRG